MEQERRPRSHVPGRLWAEAGMDRVVVELPAVHHYRFARLYAALSLLLVLAPLPWEPEASLGALVLLAMPWLYGAVVSVVSEGESGSRWGQLVRLGNGLALAAGGLIVLGLAALTAILALHWGLAERGSWGMLWLLAAAALSLGGAGRLTRPAPVVTLERARLEIRWGRQAWGFPLESIGEIERIASGEVRINGEIVPVFRFLTAAERGWVLAQIERAAQRRREALERQGHDLAAPAEPPAALLEAAGRGA